MTDAVEPMNLTVSAATAARRAYPGHRRIGAVVLAGHAPGGHGGVPGRGACRSR